jgi:hypothetical protein
MLRACCRSMTRACGRVCTEQAFGSVDLKAPEVYGGQTGAEAPGGVGATAAGGLAEVFLDTVYLTASSGVSQRTGVCDRQRSGVSSTSRISRAWPTYCRCGR